MTALKKKAILERNQVFANYGAPSDQMYGVSVADMKEIAKQILG